MPPEQINEHGLGALLNSALRAKGINQEKLAQITGISDRFITLLLEERFKELPAAPYMHGYILKIADALSLEGEEVWNNYFKNHPLLRRSGEQDIIPQNRFLRSSLRWYIAGSIIILILGYIFFRLPYFTQEPLLSLRPIETTAVVTNPSFILKGTISPHDQLTVNGEVVYSDEKGDFEKQVTLEPGLNTFTFHVEKKFGKSRETIYQISYRPASSTSTSTSRTTTTNASSIEENN